MEQAINVRDLAKRLTVAPVTVRREIERGNLHATHVGRRIVILPNEVARYLKSNSGSEGESNER
jgi:excisionase family DNA binding protein